MINKILICLIIFMSGSVVRWQVTVHNLSTNSVSGYHCAPIVKASTMEEAKKQVEINQKLATSTVLGIGQ